MPKSEKVGSALPRILPVAFFLTGATSLVFEVVWTRLLLLAFGTTPAAIGVVLGAFMGGMAIGSWAVGRVTAVDRRRSDLSLRTQNPEGGTRPGRPPANRLEPRAPAGPVSRLLSPVSCSPVRLYALLEAWIGVYALASPLLMRGGLVANGVVSLALATLVLLPATVAMGASLPLLVKALGDHVPPGSRVVPVRLSVTVGRLYAYNTAGAMAGPMLAVYVLFPSLGLHRALVAAALANVAVAASVWFVARGKSGPEAFSSMEGQGDRISKKTPDPCSGAPVVQAVRPADDRLATLLVAVSGGTAMIYEVAWSRMLSMVYGSSVYGVSLMLSTFLFGIAAGSMVAAQVLRRGPASTGSARPERVEGGGQRSPMALVRLLVASACTAFLSLFVVRHLPWLFLDLFRYGWGSDLGLVLTQFLTAVLLMLPTTLCLGAMLPVATAQASADDRAVSRLYSSNLIGSAAGAVLASMFLLANLGLDFSIRGGVLVALVASIVIVLKQPRLHLATMSLAGLSAVVVLAIDASGGRLVQSFGVYTSAPTYARYDREGMRRVIGAHQLLYYRDGPTASVAVQKVDRYVLMKINGKTDASNGADV